MFRHRTNSQKPARGLYVAFRESFPEVHAAISGEISSRTPIQNYKYISDLELTPRASHETWEFSSLSPDSTPFSSTTSLNQALGCSTPPAEGMSMLYYNEDVDLATPEIGVEMGIRTPLLLPIPGDGVHPEWIAHGEHYSPQIVQPSSLRQSNHFDPPQNLAPCYLSDQPSNSTPPDNSTETPPVGEGHTETDVHFDSSINSQLPNRSTPQPLREFAEKIRFRTTLNAATAMIHGPNEIPVTYLNKGNIYSISILDTAPTMLGSTSVWYRTSIRISFEDSQHGKKPSTHWNFWMEGRGNDEFQQRGGKMQGVEYVEARVVAEDDTRTRVNLETASIDGFSVLWSRGSGEPANCHIGVRFHFLSTDFSHSKGVKGILSRFCAKTEIVSANSLYYSSEVPEICFCKVNVFRDHGAERKLANDITYVKKSMEKIKQQIVQAETRITVSGKRKRNGSIAEKIMHSRLVKDLEHKKCPTKEDLYVKLQIMQDMLVSTQLVSLLNIRGQQQDDPDLHLVELKDGPLDLTNVNGQWSKFQSIAPSDDLQKANYQQLRSPRDQPIEVQVLQQDSPGTPDRWIRPLQVACFYILYPERQHSATKEYYHAVYIMKREAKGLIARIAPKCNFDPTSILQIVDGNQNRFNIKGDDSAVYELPEGQDMVLNFSRITALPVSREWNKVTDANFNGENARAVEEAIQTEGYLLKLIF